tara:strand:+ start:1786 stop:2619 length:834 start_codon:yes stop_codon:yes gene_type:complete
MAEGEGPTIRLLTRDDIEFACSVVELAGWNQVPNDWARLMASEPEGCFLIECDGQPAGTATTTTYGSSLGWIGMVLVHPDFRRRGLATALLNRCLEYLLEEKQVECVKLDATPDGMKVYQKLGFRAELELARWSGNGLVGDQASAVELSEAAMRELDSEAFGADRWDYLNRLAENSSGRGLLGNSYGLVRPGRIASYLGPVVADSPEIARELVVGLLKTRKPGLVYWDVLEDNKAAVALAEELGFERQRPLIRMWKGERPVTGNAELQWAIAGPATG